MREKISFGYVFGRPWALQVTHADGLYRQYFFGYARLILVFVVRERKQNGADRKVQTIDVAARYIAELYLRMRSNASWRIRLFGLNQSNLPRSLLSHDNKLIYMGIILCAVHFVCVI